jgi:hypothetical protein
MPHSIPKTLTTRTQILDEAVEMVRHAFASGIRVPSATVEAVDRAQAADLHAADFDLRALVAAHERLARLVAPASPGTLVLMSRTEAGASRLATFLGPVPLVRRMAAAAGVCVLLFMAISLTSAINPDAESGGTSIYSSTGAALLFNEVFWLAAAGIGASFAMLFRVNEFIVNRTYDPAYESSYWVKFMVGVMAGFILVTVIPDNTPDLARPLLALLGGFSASAVHRILTRVVESVEAVFRGDPREAMVVREQSVAARAAEEAGQKRISIAAQLVQLQHQVAAGADGDAISKQIAALVSSLTVDETTVPDAPSPPAAAPPPVGGGTTEEAGEDAAPRADAVQVGAIVGEAQPAS